MSTSKTIQIWISDIDDCTGVICEHGGRCEDGVNNFLCVCQDGFEGRFCEISKIPEKTYMNAL